MGIPSSGCGCGPRPVTTQLPTQTAVSAGGASIAGAIATPASNHEQVDQYTTHAAPGNGVRDPQRAQQWLDFIRQKVARFADINEAIRAGYKVNPDGGMGADQHWINDRAFSIGDAGNMDLPATLMYHFDAKGNATLVGLMVSAKPGTPLPDFGAGAWHQHADDPDQNMHIWLNKTVQQGAFENVSGMI